MTAGVTFDVPPVSPGGTPLAAATTRFVPNYVTDLPRLLHWERTDLTFFLAPDAGAERARLVLRAFGLWGGATSGVFRFREAASAESADIRIAFVPARSLGGQVVARTNTEYLVGTDAVQRADVEIDAGIAGDLLFDTAVHEIGHALGIAGHSPDPDDTMFFESRLPVAITAADLNTLKTAHSALFGARAVAAGGRVSSSVAGPVAVCSVTCPRP